MLAVLDGAPLILSSGGLRRYTEELARALGDVPVLRPQGRLWWSLQLPLALAKMGADVFHGINFEVPYLPVCPSVMTIHDMSPWRNPEWHSTAERVRNRTPNLLRLGLVTMVITPTEAVRREAVEVFRLSLSRVVAVPEAAAPHLRPTGDPVGNYFLFVGTIEPRKNVPALISAWRTLRSRYSVDLVIAGRHRQDAPAIAEEPGLRVLGEVTEDAMPSLYTSAIAVVYPSLYEGFGLPALEAMQCGTPVITTRDPALLEVSQGAAIHAGNTAEMVEAMEAMLIPEMRAQRKDLCLQRASAFSWDRTARLTREVYAEAIERWQF